jgi:hypothetical protein
LPSAADVTTINTVAKFCDFLHPGGGLKVEIVDLNASLHFVGTGVFLGVYNPPPMAIGV